MILAGVENEPFGDISHLDTSGDSRTNFVTLAFYCVIHLSNQVWWWWDRSLRWPDCSNSGSGWPGLMCELVRDEAIQYVTFTGKHGKRWEPLNKKRGKTWYEAGPFACWLQPPCYEVVIRERPWRWVCWWSCHRRRLWWFVMDILKWCSDSFEDETVRLPISIAPVLPLVLMNVCCSEFLQTFFLHLCEVPQDDICKSLLHNSRTAGGQDSWSF